jgi:tRNA nucleotidyltransferase (CCA-adding enzyme)
MKKVIERIRPERKDIEEIKEALNRIMIIEDKKIELFVGGSYAKQTLVKRDKGYDVDVFVMFPYKMASQSLKLAYLLAEILKKNNFKAVRLHGSRDYFQIKINKITVELIPILKIKKAEEAINITDISPLHVTYIKNRIKKKKKLADEIRLAKAFCYSQDCYGAESYIKGFSGYALEVLVCYYGSFMKFLKQIVKWNTKEKIIIDPKKYYKNKKEVFSELNEAKLHSPVILIDPVQKERNATAALSFKTFEKLVKIAKFFLKKPSESYFFKQKINIENLKKQAKRQKARFVMIKAITSKKKVDVAGAKTKKFYEFLFFLLKKQGFKVIKGIYNFSEESLEANFYFIVKEPEKQYIVAGPPLNINKKYLKAFKKRWKKTFENKGRLCAKATRNVFDMEQLIKTISKDQFKEMGIKKIEVI